MTTPNLPAPEPGHEPDSAINRLIDRLPKEISPGWFLLAQLILVLGVIGVAYVAGLWLAAGGGLLGLAALLAAFRRHP
ncbi:hypothetical protein [Amycolatopsis sp. NPDC004378]